MIKESSRLKASDLQELKKKREMIFQQQQQLHKRQQSMLRECQLPMVSSIPVRRSPKLGRGSLVDNPSLSASQLPALVSNDATLVSSQELPSFGATDARESKRPNWSPKTVPRVPSSLLALDKIVKDNVAISLSPASSYSALTPKEGLGAW